MPDIMSEIPPGIFLFLTAILDKFFLLLNIPEWRQYMPLGLGDPKSNGWLSHELPRPLSGTLPPLLTYNDYLQSTKSDFGPSSMYKFAFQTSDTSLGDLLTYDSMIVLFCLVLILRRVKKTLNPMFCNIGRTLGRKTHGEEWEKDNEEKIIKFGEYVFRFIYHFFFSVYGLVYFWDKPWWDKSRGGTIHLWMGYPNHVMEPGMTWYYMTQSAYNVDAFISLIELSFVFKLQNPFQGGSGLRSPIDISWSKTVRGDFREMFIHHVITNGLILGSSLFRFTRIGSMVFMIHDISDVPVDLSKLANFMKWTEATVFCFLTMVIVWIITRMYILPFIIVKSAWYESPLLYTHGTFDLKIYKLYFPFFMGLMVGITMLHYFWFAIFIRIARALTKGKVQDYSEHKQDQPEDTSKKTD